MPFVSLQQFTSLPPPPLLPRSPPPLVFRSICGQAMSRVGTPHYMAPEILRAEAYNEMVDVYSYGMLLFEMATGSVPYAGAGANGGNLNAAQVLFKVFSGERPPLPDWVDADIRALIERCWAENPAARPTVSVILADLKLLAQGKTPARRRPVDDAIAYAPTVMVTGTATAAGGGGSAKSPDLRTTVVYESGDHAAVVPPIPAAADRTTVVYVETDENVRAASGSTDATADRGTADSLAATAPTEVYTVGADYFEPNGLA